ncbi:MAG: polysaccharide biosynthesis protein, partial [Candidatus Omnitrophica bacterium]|nr:polysaccharide biosynthesis protein [Candidatus Omnitrophota bacterium]
MTMKDFIHKYRRAMVVIANIVFVSVAYIAAFLIRFEFNLPVVYYTIILKTLPALIIIKGVSFYCFGLYSGLWKYVSMDDLWQILKATVISTVAFVVFVVFSHGLAGFPRSIFILDWILCIGLVSGARLFMRSLRENYMAPNHKTGSIRALVVGAGETG